MLCKSERAAADGDRIGGRSSSRHRPLLTPALSSPGRRGGVEGAATLSLLPVAVEVTLALSTTFPLRLRGRGTGGGGTIFVRAALGTAVAGGCRRSRRIPLVPLNPGESHLSQLIPLSPGESRESRESHFIPLDPCGSRQEEEKSRLRRPRGGGRACVERRSATVGTIVEGGCCPSHGIPLIPLNLTQSRESQLIPANPACLTRSHLVRANPGNPGNPT